jgi:hypothetical protein
MSRQNRPIVRDRKSEELKREVSNSNDRYSRNSREEDSRNENSRPQTTELDRFRLNDLYERSSI